MQKLKGFLKDSPVSKQFWYLVLWIVFCVSISSVFTSALLKFFFEAGPHLDEAYVLTTYNARLITGLKISQLMYSVALFIVPSLVFAWSVDTRPIHYLGLNTTSPFISYVGVLLVMIVSVPAMSQLIAWNESMKLPSIFSSLEDWMRESEERASLLTEKFLTMHSWGDFLFNIILIAAIPALGEEVLFRGVLQPLFHRAIGNIHAAIWLSAFIFSALHLQFFGFFPRWIFGVLFGYLYFWSGNLKIPFFAHFINNLSVVTLYFFVPYKKDREAIENFGENNSALFLISIALTGIFLYYLHNIFEQKQNETADKGII